MFVILRIFVKKYLKSVVSPASKFQFALLIVKREPRDVDLTGALENTWRKVTATAVVPNHDVSLVSAVEFLISTKRV